ncbi:MAG: hypothetical protein QOE23_3331 [Pseudonocardiales bacterium]|nr:hypothetical protein [Pseudonocardiales bacterium]
MQPSTSPAQLLRQAATAALLAPSLHDTKPWRFVLADDVLEIHADRSRQLSVIDPTGRTCSQRSSYRRSDRTGYRWAVWNRRSPCGSRPPTRTSR